MSSPNLLSNFEIHSGVALSHSENGPRQMDESRNSVVYISLR